MRKRFKTMLCGVLAATLVHTGGCALLPQEEVLPDAPVMRADEIEAFDMTVVKRGDLIKEQRYSVNYRAVRQEKLYFEVEGLRIEEVHVVKGDSVRAGQLLMELEQGELSEEGKAAQEQCDTLELQLEQANEALEMSRDEYELKLRYMTAEEREEADTMEEYLRDQYRAIEKLEDQLLLAEKTASQVNKSVRQRQLRAGIDGVVTYVRGVSTGDVSSMTDMMITLSDSESSMFVVETEFTDQFSEGMELDVIVNQTHYPCRVISAQEAGASGEDEVYLKSDIPTAELSDGDSGYLMLVTECYEDVLYVEKSAVKSMNGQHFVYVEDETSLRSTHEVTVGVTLNGYIEILSGLSEGDRVILR